MINGGQRTKGHNGEREFCKLINEHPDIKPKAERNVDQTRLGGADIVSIKPFAIEIKRQQQLSIKRWLAQAENQTSKKNYFPVLAYRRNREKWTVMVPVDLMVKKKWRPGGRREWMSISVDYFLWLVSQIGV